MARFSDVIGTDGRNGMRLKGTRAMLIAAVLVITVADARAADIVTVIAGRANLSILASAIAAAGMTDMLKGSGPFTVFAPTNDAFKRLPANALTNLLKPENREQLVKLLTYHVVPVRLAAKDMDGKMFTAKSVNGKDIEIDADDPGEGIKINKGKITQPDLAADNGVIHEITRVLLP
jgi:uncharacterized surface protein with fasciclin (FAS1) repeats